MVSYLNTEEKLFSLLCVFVTILFHGKETLNFCFVKDSDEPWTH